MTEGIIFGLGIAVGAVMASIILWTYYDAKVKNSYRRGYNGGFLNGRRYSEKYYSELIVQINSKHADDLMKVWESEGK